MGEGGDGPLAGVRVVEFAGLGPGPFAAMMLADAGAEVLRIDRPSGPVDGGALTRGRPWLGVDLKSPGGRELANTVITRADVLVEGFRPGVMERLGLGPREVARLNPGLVYGRMTGWGQDGPRSAQAGHDINYLALTGALRSIARRGAAPVPPLNIVVDYGGGGMLLFGGILMALLERQRSGRGQTVDAAMVDGVSLLMTGIWSRLAQGRWPGGPGGNELDSGAPFYDVYRTLDGEYMAVGSIEPQFWGRLLRVLKLDPARLPDQWDRGRWPEVKQRIGEVFASASREVWIERFAGVDACVTPVLSLDEAVSDPHMRARGTLVAGADGAVQPASAPRLGRTPPTVRRQSPTADELLDRWEVGTAGRRC